MTFHLQANQTVGESDRPSSNSQDFICTFLKEGENQLAQISDLAQDKCYQLAVANGAVEVIANETGKVALLFDNATCAGEPIAAAGPGEKANGIKAVVVAFAEAGHDDEAGMPGDGPDEDLFSSAFRAID